MPETPANLEAVLKAAEALLEAREDQMVTADEWDALRNAAEACPDDQTPAISGLLELQRTRVDGSTPPRAFSMRTGTVSVSPR